MSSSEERVADTLVVTYHCCFFCGLWKRWLGRGVVVGLKCGQVACFVPVSWPGLTYYLEVGSVNGVCWSFSIDGSFLLPVSSLP